MRMRIVTTLLAGWLSVGAASAQYPGDAIIIHDVEVHSGPSYAFLSTSKLSQGDKVHVLRRATDPAWLEITPPPQSFSWVQQKFLKQTSTPREWVVDTPAPIRPGSMISQSEPNREIMTLQQGTIVRQIGDQPAMVQGVPWIAINPHVNEVRYIPTDAVQASTTPATVPQSGIWNRPTSDSYIRDKVLAQAMDRENKGDRQGAILLYQQAANTPNADPNTVSIARNAIARLQQQPYGMGQGTYGAVQGTTTSMSPANRTPPPTAAAANLMTLKAAEWSAWGRLREIKMTTIDGQQLYTLVDSQERIITYVASTQGKSLETYVGRWIAVYGPTLYRADSTQRMPYVVASSVAVP